MYFFVIEGDNGTGKDSLAQKFQTIGFKIITYDNDIREIEKNARLYDGKARVQKFIEYNKACGDKAEDEKRTNNVILVRYLVSSLAAGYADNIFSANETIDLFNKIYDQFPKPDIIIELKCKSEERIKRIEKRNSKIFDDKSLDREKKYRWIIDKIKSNINEKWIEIDTTNLNIEEVFNSTLKKIKNLNEKAKGEK